ncbi:hypothetical protein EsDP_00006561 [Epichloe bromicola]|uniref:DUF1275 domain protein n=1 Tax=Epichloe bromicola TaxID=79588 RepID=A0ABQ0CY25_9HYPO
MGGYGTTRDTSNNPSQGTNGTHGNHDQQPLLGRKLHAGSRPRLARFRKQMTSEVSRSHTDLVLLLCYVVTGLLDSASTQVWGAFVSMQTGNTIYVGLGLASLVNPPVNARLYKSGISLLSFCIGSIFFACFHRCFSPRRRWVLCASFAAQAALTIAAAVIVMIKPTPEDGNAVGWAVLLPLALVSLQSCGQAVASRALGYNALTSVVLTSIYCDLFSDQHLFKLENVERNRRAAAPILLLAGAAAGGLLSRSSFGVQGALWVAAVMKSLLVVVWVFWSAEEDES